MHRRRGQRPAGDRETVSRVLIHRFATRGECAAPPNDDTNRMPRGLSHDHYFHPLSNSKQQQQRHHHERPRARRKKRRAPRPTENIEIEIGCRDVRHVSGFRRPGGRLLADSVKEVIQPQVPLRLPCYDFAPVTALAFGRLAPCGFRHGLRALTASMA